VDVREGYALVLLALGPLLILFPEIFHVVDFNGRGELSRFNTIFKMHLQSWVFFGIAAAWALARLRQLRPAIPVTARLLWVIILSILFAACAIYPVAGTLAKCSLASKFRAPTLDGTAYMARSNAGDYGAVRWLNEKAERSSLVLEATGDGYNTWYSRISIFTGLPTVVGWGGHELQWRDSEELVRRRERLVATLYTMKDEARAGALIEDIGIDYVVAGELERERYGLGGLEKFPRLMELVYSGGGTSLFRRRGASPGDRAGSPRPRPLIEDVALSRSMFVGGVGDEPGEFREPRGAASDGSGGVYVVDFGNARVQHFDDEGHFLHAWGRGGDGRGEFDDPCGIAVDIEGYVYVADTWNSRIQKFDPLGNCLAVWTEKEVGLYGPRGLVVSDDGMVYVADTGHHRIVVFDRGGVPVASWGVEGDGRGEMVHPTDIAIDGRGRVLVADAGNRRIQIFERDGRPVDAWPVAGWIDGTYNEPCLVTGAEMRRAAVSASVQAESGGAGEGARPGREERDTLSGAGAAESSVELVYLSDPLSHRILCYTIDGEPRGSVGGEGEGLYEFRFPIGVAPDGAGELLVVDCLNNRVQRIAPESFR
jgi:DNA-binding beta-propeller fold protein YncE